MTIYLGQNQKKEIYNIIPLKQLVKFVKFEIYNIIPDIFFSQFDWEKTKRKKYKISKSSCLITWATSTYNTINIQFFPLFSNIPLEKGIVHLYGGV